MEIKDPHILSIEELERLLNSDKNNGLTESIAMKRLSQFGPNTHSEIKKSILWLYVRQFLNGFTFILTIAFILSFATSHWIEGCAMVTIIIINTSISFYQEYKSEKTISSLKSMSTPTAFVIRDKSLKEIKTSDIVVGDLISFRAGMVSPADIRVIECYNLCVDESILTGENEPIYKTDSTIEENENEPTPLAEKYNMIFQGCTIMKGKGKGFVVSTGMNTEMGKVINMVNSSKKSTDTSKTPLQKTMDKFAYILLGISIILMIVVLGVNRFSLKTDIILYSVTVGICMIPEALIAVTTLTIANGVKRMAKFNAIVRRIASLEVFGQVTHICSDKTGTLTEAKMVARYIWIPSIEDYFKVKGSSMSLEGDIIYKRKKVTNFSNKLNYLLICCHFCNQSTFEESNILGEPTEVALKVLYMKASKFIPSTFKYGDSKTKTIKEFEFSSKLKMMSIIVSNDNTEESCNISEDLSYSLFTKGAPERVLDSCRYYAGEDNNDTSFNVLPLSTKFKKKVMKMNDQLASKGLRVLAFAFRDNIQPKIAKKSREHLEKDLIFLGLVGIFDPPRKSSKQSIAQCVSFGVKVHMLTGDHLSTAISIAKRIGIFNQDDMDEERDIGMTKCRAMTSTTFDSLSHDEIDQLDSLPYVLARCSPESKVNLIDALHRRGNIVAMTGDGINDAPALSCADVGIAMGRSGSDATREVADIVLLDDNIETVVKAIIEGRRISNNIAKYVLYLLSGNVALMVTLLAGLGIKDSDGISMFPMAPILILWVNLLTSTPPAVGLGVDPYTPSSSKQKLGHLFSKERLLDMFYYGIVVGLLSFGGFVYVIYVLYDGNIGNGCNDYGAESVNCESIYRARGTSSLIMSTLLVLHALNCKDHRKSIFQIDLSDNLQLLITVFGCLIMAVLPLYIPGLNTIVCKQLPIDKEWIIIAVSIIIFGFMVEIYKLIKRSILKD